jgi:sugar transferase (PEP-CTERM system associated)
MFEIFRSVRLRRLFLCETVLILMVAVFSVRLRIGLGFSPEEYAAADEWPYWVEACIAGITIPVAVQLAMYYLELYTTSPLASRTQILVRLLMAHLIAGVALALLYYLVPQYRVQRLALFMTMAISSWLLFSLRFHFEEILYSDSFRRRVLVLGTGVLAQRIGRDLLSRPGSGFELAGFLAKANIEPGMTLLGRPLLGSLNELMAVVERHQIDDVVFAPDEQRGLDWLMLPLIAVKLRGSAVHTAQQFVEALLHCMPVDLLRPSVVAFDTGFQPSRFTLTVKRGADVVLSLLALLLAAPIMVATAVCIAVDSPGPILYRQQRVGRGGALFTIFKFRSMRVQRAGEKERLTARNDDRITRVGRFIRQHRIDELPQFFNVVLGDMSLVGPRPEVLYSVEEQRKAIPFYDQRHAIKPGITSLGQVRYGAATTNDEARERLKYDLYYQKNMSLAFDLSILIDTVKVVLLGTGAR